MEALTKCCFTRCNETPKTGTLCDEHRAQVDREETVRENRKEAMNRASEGRRIEPMKVRVTPEFIKRTNASLAESERMLNKARTQLAREVRFAEEGMLVDQAVVKYATEQITFLTGHIAKLQKWLTQDEVTLSF